ncbi:MAG: VWA domain-containing protein [Chloroflexota bacterium]|nr:VWA domain-containing protein [Chloroflexota bacterium]
MAVYRYSRWDGSQDVPDLDADAVMDAIADSLTMNGDVRQALQRLLQLGLGDWQGQRLMGIRDMLQELRAMKRRTLDRYDLSSIFDDIRERLDDIVSTEREGIERRLEEAGEQDADLRKALESVAARNLEFLDGLPEDVAAAIKGLASYEFIDPQARQQFAELMEMLKERVMGQYFQDMYRGLQAMSAEDIQGLKDMVGALNEMLRQRIQGGEPDFEGFMERFGDQFGPERPRSLDELMEMLTRRMAQMESLLESLPQEQKGMLDELVEAMMEDQGLRDQMAELAAYLDLLFPTGDLRSRYPFRGVESLSLEEALGLMEELQQMGELERQLDRSRSGPDLEGIDDELVRRLLGEEAHRSLEQMRRLADVLEEAGYISRRGRRWELTPRAVRRVGEKALKDIFKHLKEWRLGRHEVWASGLGGDRADETKRYQFGDPFHLQVERTLMNSLKREGPGRPVRLKEEDFEVYQTEHLTQCSTVLMLDMSWSMPMRGNFFAAKKVALALDSLIRTQFPRDNLYIVGFSDYATELTKEMLFDVNWNEFVYGTNMHHGLMLARQLLSRHKGGSKQIIMVTDGEPTAHLEGGRAYFDYPPSPRTLIETLREAKRCASDGIVVNVFMLDSDPYISRFIDDLVKGCRGRAFYTSAEELGRYMVHDYIAGRRRTIVP